MFFCFILLYETQLRALCQHIFTFSSLRVLGNWGRARLIPLGTRGKLRGTDYEVIGFQRRSTKVEGITYYWQEYVLFNPYKAIRYFSEYHGHWNDISVCKTLPAVGSKLGGSSLTANYLGETYKHFQSAEANTDFVLGEFPWQVRVGELAEVTDFVHPPRVLSSEKLQNEVTWSIGEYMYGREVWDAFQLPGAPPEAMGVYENQDRKSVV